MYSFLNPKSTSRKRRASPVIHGSQKCIRHTDLAFPFSDSPIVFPGTMIVRVFFCGGVPGIPHRVSTHPPTHQFRPPCFGSQPCVTPYDPTRRPPRRDLGCTIVSAAFNSNCDTAKCPERSSLIFQHSVSHICSPSSYPSTASRCHFPRHGTRDRTFFCPGISDNSIAVRCHISFDCFSP